MSALDPRALIFASGAMNLVCAGVMFLMARTFPPAIRGLRPWAWGCLLCLFSAPLYMARDYIPDLFSIVLANSLLVAGLLFQYVAIAQFTDQEAERNYLMIVWGVVMAGITWFGLVTPNYYMRQLVVSTSFAGLFYFTLRLLRHSEESYAQRLLVSVYLLQMVLSVGRLMLLLTHETGSLGTGLLDPTPLLKAYLAMFTVSGMMSTLGFMLMAHERLFKMLRYAATHDELSGALTHGAILDALDREIARASRHQQPLSILMLDLDFFKRINDTYGHQVGDRVIVDFAGRVLHTLRQPDTLGRYGGEEFLAILPHTSGLDAMTVAERIRGGLLREGGLPAYTVSIGVASYDAGDTSRTLIAAADEALYRAKTRGRNRVELEGRKPASGLQRQSAPVLREVPTSEKP